MHDILDDNLLQQQLPKDKSCIRPQIYSARTFFSDYQTVPVPDLK
jgi:hypothetical protein